MNGNQARTIWLGSREIGRRRAALAGLAAAGLIAAAVIVLLALLPGSPSQPGQPPAAGKRLPCQRWP